MPRNNQPKSATTCSSSGVLQLAMRRDGAWGLRRGGGVGAGRDDATFALAAQDVNKDMSVSPGPPLFLSGGRRSGNTHLIVLCPTGRVYAGWCLGLPQSMAAQHCELHLSNWVLAQFEGFFSFLCSFRVSVKQGQTPELTYAGRASAHLLH